MLIFQDIYKECCLTCQYCTDIRRRMRARGKILLIEYDKVRCSCSLVDDLSTTATIKSGLQSCHYKKWIDIP